MSTLTINGARVISGTVTMPYYGTWSADLILATPDDITSPATLVAGDLTLVGTVVRKASFAGSRSARIVGGGGGWRKVIPPRGYSHEAGVKLSSVLQDAAKESGESLALASDKTIGTHYVRDEGKAERVLNIELGGKWWVDGAGITQTKTRDATAVVAPFTVIAWSGAKGQFEIATESIASWVPGRTFTAPTVSGTQTVSSVTIEASNDGKLRLHILSTNGETERLRADLRSLIRSEIAALNYLGVWEYTVASGDDTTVDVTSSDPRMPSLTKVPMMPSLLGEVVTPAPGSRCRIVFVNGDPTRPECIGIGGTPTLSVLSGGTFGAARVTDAIQAGPFAGTIVAGSTKVKVG